MSNVLKDGELVARNVTIITLFLALGKLGAGLLTNSVAILADAFHSFSDLIPIFAAYLGLKIAQRPKSEEFPYGYYKAENLAALFSSLFIFLLGFEILRRSVSRIFVHSAVTNDAIGIGMIVVSFFVSLWLYKYQMSAARRTGSQALMANALETKMDVFSVVLVFIGFISAVFGIPYIEGSVGILLSLLVFHAGYESARDSVMALMDAGVGSDEIDKIRSAIKSVNRVKSVKSVFARRSGPFVMVEATVTVPSSIGITQAHSIANQIEKKLADLDFVDHAVVHVEPESKERLVARPVNEDGTIAKVFGSAPYFDIYRLSGSSSSKSKIKVRRVKNPGFGLSKKRGVKAALFLVDQGVDEVEVVNIGDDSREILESAGISVRKLGASEKKASSKDQLKR